MGRRKIVMDYITDDRKRMSTFEKRRIGLFKKARELSKLCGVNIKVTIVNKKSLYQFSNLKKDDFAHQALNPDLKIEENFNNDSFQEYITRRTLVNKNSTESSSNEYRSVCQDPVCLNSDEDEDAPFFKVLQERKVLDSFIKIQHVDSRQDAKNVSDVPAYIPSVVANNNSFNNATTDNCPSFSFTQSLESIDCSSTSRSDLLSRYSGSTIDSVFPNDSISFDTIVTTMQHDPAIFGNSVWESHQQIYPVTSNLRFFQSQNNDYQIDLDTPTLESWNHLLPSSDLEAYSAKEIDIISPKKPRIADDNIACFNGCVR